MRDRERKRGRMREREREEQRRLFLGKRGGGGQALCISTRGDAAVQWRDREERGRRRRRGKIER